MKREEKIKELSAYYAYFAYQMLFILLENSPLNSLTCFPLSTEGHGMLSPAYIHKHNGINWQNTDRKTWAQAQPTQGYLYALRMSGKKPPCHARDSSGVQEGCLNLRQVRCWQLQRALSSWAEKESKRGCISLSQPTSNMTQLPLTRSSKTTSSYVPPPPPPAFIRRV